LASFYYIKHETIYDFDKKLKAEISLPELIRIISYAKEFEEVPLRHNEENMNEELSKSCPLSCNKKAFDSPNEKTYLLF
jgi:activating signal cointegrator complex subunit 3